MGENGPFSGRRQQGKVSLFPIGHLPAPPGDTITDKERIGRNLESDEENPVWQIH
jgi:hypothetical protein